MCVRRGVCSEANHTNNETRSCCQTVRGLLRACFTSPASCLRSCSSRLHCPRSARSLWAYLTPKSFQGGCLTVSACIGTSKTDCAHVMFVPLPLAARMSEREQYGLPEASVCRRNFSFRLINIATQRPKRYPGRKRRESLNQSHFLSFDGSLPDGVWRTALTNHKTYSKLCA